MAATLEVPDFDYEADDSGNVVVVATVRNVGDERAERTVTVELATNDTEERRSADVALEIDESVEERFAFDIPVSAFEAGGSIEFDLGA